MNCPTANEFLFAMKRIPYSAEPTSGDVRDLPIYSSAEASFYLDVPKVTIHNWLRARTFKDKVFQPLVVPADPVAPTLSYNNLAELHILSVVTRVHKVKMKDVRRAMDYIKENYPSSHPLLSREFRTDGHDLFAKIAEGGRLDPETNQIVNFTRHGQLGLSEILEQYLERVIRDENFLPLKFYPVARGQDKNQKIVCIMPTVSSGRPIIDEIGIPVSSLWNRFDAGDTIPELADDYEISEDAVRAAIRYVEATAA
ncbi:MAG: DUF433 domain-containing protein [Acidobacteriaceae bacterium]